MTDCLRSLCFVVSKVNTSEAAEKGKKLAAINDQAIEQRSYTTPSMPSGNAKRPGLVVSHCQKAWMAKYMSVAR